MKLNKLRFQKICIPTVYYKHRLSMFVIYSVDAYFQKRQYESLI